MQESNNYELLLNREAHHLSDRALVNASKWLAELASVYHEDSAAAELQDLLELAKAESSSRASPAFTDRYYLARRYFDCKELHKCVYILKDSCDDNERWLWLYSAYLSAQSKLTGNARPLSRTNTTRKLIYIARYLDLLDNRSLQLDEISTILVDIGESQDSFLLYLKALVLAEVKQRRAAIACLVTSIQKYTYNWSAWVKLADLLDGEEELILISNDLPRCLIAKFFFTHANLEVHRASDTLRSDISVLQTLFPRSLHLQAQHALCEYHLRDFDLAERLFDDIGAKDPYRMEELDTYSNILYVMGKGGKLAQIAQKYFALDPNRPEVCCLVGNLYSLRGDHPKAIAMFRQALKLDRGYLTAWTLMGHEYVELSNTHAAIESYRRACQANRKDYRAWYGLGQAYELLGMYAYALQYFQKAAALRPFDSRMWQALAQCYAKLARPHEVLKCYKRAQLLVEPDDITNLGKLGDHCLSMNLLEEAAMYWTRIIGTATTHGLPLQDYAQVYVQLARYEMGEYHVRASQVRVVGDLALADMYLAKVAGQNVEDVDTITRLQKKIRELQLL